MRRKTGLTIVIFFEYFPTKEAFHKALETVDSGVLSGPINNGRLELTGTPERVDAALESMRQNFNIKDTIRRAA